MIISDRHKFVFIHIPKCAGTSVRNPLTPFNDWQRAGPPWQKECSGIGELDYGHIPLFVLREHFPNEFQAMQEYWSFTVMRDPFARFASSVSQRLKMYGNQPIQKCSFDEIREAIDESINYLSSQPRNGYLLPPEYIHFQKQVDYIQLDGDCIVDKIYLVDEVDALLVDLSHLINQEWFESASSGSKTTKANTSVVFRNDLVRLVMKGARPITKHFGKILSESTRQRIRGWIYVPRDQRMRDLFSEKHVRAFISDYYQDDIRLFERVRQYHRCDEAS